MHDKNGSCFKFTIGNVVYEFINELWESLFGISVCDPDVEDGPDPSVTDVHTHVHYEGNVDVNEMLRDPRPEGSFEPLTTG